MALYSHKCALVDCATTKTYPLHHAVWNRDNDGLRNAIAKSENVNCIDCRARTPLMLATILKNRSAIDLLLQAGASAIRKDDSGFTAFDFALGNPGDIRSFSAPGFQMLNTLYRYQQAHKSIFIAKRFSLLLTSLSRVSDFYYDIHFEYSTIVPFMSNSLPSDSLHVYKKGSIVRVDSRIKDLDDDGKFVYGNISYVFRNKNAGFELTTIDHEKLTFEKYEYLTEPEKVLQEFDSQSQIIENKLKKLPVKITTIPTSLINLKPTDQGQKFDSTYDCTQFVIENLIEITSRRLSNKMNTQVSELEYFNGNVDLLPILTHKEDKLSAELWFPVSAEQHPLKATQLYPIIELMELIIPDFKKYIKICTSLPSDQVPVKFVLKVLPLKVLRMKVELSNLMSLVSPVRGVTNNFDGSCSLSHSLFDIPNGYNEAE